MAERLVAFDQLRRAAERRGLANVREVRSDAEFQRHLDAAGNSLIVVDFSANWCPPSIMMEPVMADLSEKYPETVFLKVDAEICTQTAELYEIKGYPTFVFIKNKKQLQQSEGASQSATRVVLELCITGLSEFPDSCITTRSLQHLESIENISIKDEIAPIWLEIAMFMNVSPEIIRTITSEYSEPLQCSDALLEYWIDLENDVPKPPTWRVLLDALRSNNKADLATKIEHSKEREPKIFDEIEQYISKKALKEKYEQMLSKLGQKIQLCDKRSSELKNAIEQKDTEIASLKKQVSMLQAQVHKEDTQSSVQESQGCDIPGVERVGGITYTVSSLPQVFKWKNYSIRLRIPEGAVVPDVLPMKLRVTASLRGQYKFPEGYEPVSGVYCISLPLELAESATLDIEHCVEITHAYQCSSLSFASCSQRNPPYKFELVEGGIFNPRSPCGSIRTTHFSLWGIVLKALGWEQGDAEPERPPITATPVEPSVSYSAQLFYLRNPGIYSWMLHFVIIPNLEISIAAIQKVFKGAYKGADNLPVIYEDDEITLSIPMGGVKQGSWSLRPILHPMIKREEADRYSPASPAIPNCQIRLKWEDCQRKPEELIYLVHLKGAKAPRNSINIMFEPDEQVLDSPTASHPEATCKSSPTHLHPGQHSRYTPGLDSEPELADLMNEVASEIPCKWRAVGLQLGVSQGVLDGIAASRPEDINNRFSDVFTKWKNQNLPAHPYTWSTVVQVLQNPAVGENRLADNIIKKFTIHQS